MLRLALLAILVQTVVGGGGQSGGGGHHKPPGGGGGDGHHGGGGGNDGRPSKPTAGPPVALPTPQPSSAFRRRLVVFGDSLSDDGSKCKIDRSNACIVSNFEILSLHSRSLDNLRQYTTN